LQQFFPAALYILTNRMPVTLMAMPMMGITVLILLITLVFLIMITMIIETIGTIGTTIDQTGVGAIVPIGEQRRAGEIPVIVLEDEVNEVDGANN
jgi:hypothetical protein